MDHLISLYIDNELSVEEKILFLEHVYGNKAYKDDAVSLLEQEKLLWPVLKHQAPDSVPSTPRKLRSFRPYSLAIAACLLLIFAFLAGTNLYQHHQSSQNLASVVEGKTNLHRFVLFDQDSQKIEITGSFTNWQKLPLTPTGPGGYWEITLEVPAGEHRYSFIIDDLFPQPDPTVVIQEADDFGAMNSILHVES